MYIFFQDDIDKETVIELIDKLEQYQGQINLYFSTEGGCLTPMYFLIDYLNSRKDEITIHLVDELISAGTYLLTDFEGKIIIEDSLDLILFHKADRSVYTLRQNNVIDEKILVQQTEAGNKRQQEKLKLLGLNDKQLKLYSQGKDVVLYKKDFNQLKLNKG